MKKIAGVLALLLLLTMLGGCYKADTTVDLNLGGGVEVSSSFLAVPEMYQQSAQFVGYAGPDDIVTQYDPATLEQYLTESGITETGQRLELSRIDASGNVVETGTELPTDGSMTGVRLRMKYDSLSDAADSFTLTNFSALYGLPLQKDASGYGLDIQQKQTLFGTQYSVTGKFGINGTDTHQMLSGMVEDAALKERVSEASNSITFKFPLAISSSNADEKGFLGQSLTWTATNDAPEKEVYFVVYTINPLILGMALVIIILLIALIVVARKKNDGPDAYFVDAEGNPIPVYDEESEEDETEADVEVFEFAEETDGTDEEAVVTEETMQEVSESDDEEDTETTDTL